MPFLCLWLLDGSYWIIRHWKSLGPLGDTGGLYQTVITILVESFALYAISLILYIATWTSNNFMVYPLTAITSVVQVCIILLMMLSFLEIPVWSAWWTGYHSISYHSASCKQESIHIWCNCLRERWFTSIQEPWGVLRWDNDPWGDSTRNSGCTWGGHCWVWNCSVTGTRCLTPFGTFPLSPID